MLCSTPVATCNITMGFGRKRPLASLFTAKIPRDELRTRSACMGESEVAIMNALTRRMSSFEPPPQ